jgi:hypothetical protein
VQIGAGPGDAYLDGAIYSHHEPLNAQMAFRLVYDLRWLLLDTGWAGISALGLLVVAGLLYAVPGWALLAWLWPGKKLSWAEGLGIAVGLNLALYPLLFLWTDLARLHLGALYVWLPVAGGLTALIWRYRDWRPWRGWEAIQAWARSSALWPDLALLFVTGLIFGVRLLVVRSLDAPMWGDSYQHTMVTQLMLENGGLFDSWAPYVPYRTLSIHFGFPAEVALFSWGTGIDSTRAVLLVGQLINGLAVLTLYPLALRFTDGNRWAGVGTVLVAGLLSTTPACYVNWGRYAQLAAQAILPTALWLLWETVHKNDLCWKTTLSAGITLAGMMLCNYRMPFFYGSFVLAWLIGWGLPRWKWNARRWQLTSVRLALIAVIALVLFLPWGLQIAGGWLTTKLGTSVVEGSTWELVLADYRIWRQVASYVPQTLLITVLIVLIWNLVRRQWGMVSIGLWVLVLSSLKASRLIRLPGANMFDNFAVVIALYIPVSLLLGWLIGQIAVLAGRWMGKAGQWATRVAIIAVALWAAGRQMKIVQPSYVLVTRPDTRAMGWIRKNTPQNALFLVEGFRVFRGRSAVGADAGWWISLLAGRQNTMPPQYALVQEAPTDPDYTRRVVDLVARLETTLPASPEGIAALCEWGITHVYVGQGQGKVGAGARQLFSPDALMTSSDFDVVYQQDRVHVFALHPQACGANGR